MQLQDLESKAFIHSLGIRLTRREAQELHDGLEDLLASPGDDHVHVSNDEFQVELIVTISDETIR